MSSIRRWGLLIFDDASVDRVAETAFECASCFGGGFHFGEFLLVVVLALTAGTDLAQGHKVQRTVELSVTGPGEPVSAVLTAGGLNRCGPAVAGVVMSGRESADLPGVAQDLGREHRPDPVQGGQRRFTGADRGLDLCGIGAQRSIEPTQISQEILRERLAVFIGWGHRAHGAQQASRVGGGQVPFRTASDEVTQQCVQPVGGASPFLSEIIPAVREQPQTHAVTLGAHQAKPRVVHRDCGHRGRVQRVGLASMTSS